MAAHLLDQFPEGAVFHSYHAFESIACAALALVGHKVPQDHRQKLQQFQARFRAHQFSENSANLATELEHLRDQALYPRDRGSQVFTRDPERLWTREQVQYLHERVLAMVHAIVQELSL